MVQMKANYEVKLGQPDKDTDDILSLWCEGFDNFTIDVAKRKLVWSYIDNPSGEGFVFLLRENKKGETAGVQCLSIRNWDYSGTTYKSGIMADYVVGKKHRSLGPALKLLENVISESRTSVDFIYGFPNRKALPVFKRAGYRELGRIGRYAKILKSKRVLKDRMPVFTALLISPVIDGLIRINLIIRSSIYGTGIKTEWTESFNGCFDQLWDFNRNQSELISNRSARVLAWRFESDAEQNDWKIFTIVNKEDEMLGYIVVKIIEKVAVIGDFYAKNSNKNFQRLFLLFSVQAIKLGCDSISLEFFGAQRIIRKLGWLGFKLREDNPFYYLPSNEQLTMFERHELYVTSYDRDM